MDLPTGWTVQGSSAGGGENFCTRPDRPWGPPSLLNNRHLVSLQGVKRLGRGVDHPLPSTAEVKEWVELYVYSPSEPSWFALGWSEPFNLNVPSDVGLPRCSFLLKPYMHFSYFPFVPQAQPMSSTLIWSPNNWPPNTNCEKFRDIKIYHFSTLRFTDRYQYYCMQRDRDKESELPNWFRLRNRDGSSFLNDWQRQWRF
jgi:hypothetical protein